MSYLRKDGYVQIRLGGRRLALEHRWVWEQAHGPIPVGYEIHHLDRNRANNALSNLEMLTRDEHRRLHRLHPVDRTCDRCGAAFSVPSHYTSKKRYCSAHCARLASWDTRRKAAA